MKRFHTLFKDFCYKYWLCFKILEIYTKSLKNILWRRSFFSKAVAWGPVTTLLKQYITSSFLCANALFSEDRWGLLSFLWGNRVLYSHVDCRSSLSEMFYKKVVLKNFAKFTGKHLCQSLFLKKLQAIGLSLTKFFLQ